MCAADYHLYMNMTTGAEAKCVLNADSVKCTGGIARQLACGGASAVLPSLLAMAFMLLVAFFRA
jgi:hypothetical protein